MKKLFLFALISIASVGITSMAHAQTGKDDSNKSKTYYDPYGDLIGTATYFDYDKLPKAALKTIATVYEYPEYELQECIAFKNDAGKIYYYVSLNRNGTDLVLEISQGGIVSEFTD